MLSALLEGCSIRATSRLTGVQKNTITRLMVDAGEYCETLIDRELRNLPCRVIEADEIWTFVRKKQGHLTPADALDSEAGDQYTFIGLDPNNWIRPHGSLHGMTPAMALGVASTFWSVDRLIP